jgi:hypothetical protein
MLTNNARCTREIKSAQKVDSFHQKIGLKYIRKELVKRYILIIALYGHGTGKLWKVDQKYLERFEMCCCSRMGKIIWTDHVKHVEILHAVKKTVITHIK